MQSETKKNHTEYRNFLINKTHRKLALYFHGKYHGDTIEKVSKTCPVQRDATLNHPNPGKNLHVYTKKGWTWKEIEDFNAGQIGLKKISK